MLELDLNPQVARSQVSCPTGPAETARAGPCHKSNAYESLFVFPEGSHLGEGVVDAHIRRPKGHRENWSCNNCTVFIEEISWTHAGKASVTQT